MASSVNDVCDVCGGKTSSAPEYPHTGYVRCRTCTTLIRPVAVERYGDSYFDDYAGQGGYDDRPASRRHEARLRARWVLAAGGGGAVMEIGSASGYFVRAARGLGLDVEGIEPAPGVAASAQRLNQVHVEAQTLEELAASGRTFDTVCLWHVLEHLEEPAVNVSRLFGLLEPGGLLFLELPNERSGAAKRRRGRWKPLDPQHHVRHYGPGSVTTLLRSAGFELVRGSTHRFTTYLPLRPIALVGPAAYLYESWQSATLRPVHPSAHELLRVIARRPAA